MNNQISETFLPTEADRSQTRTRRETALRWIRVTALILLAFELVILVGELLSFQFQFRSVTGVVAPLYMIWLCWSLPTATRLDRWFLIVGYWVFSSLRLVSAALGLWQEALRTPDEPLQTPAWQVLAFPISQAVVCLVISLLWLLTPKIKEYFRTVDKVHTKADLRNNPLNTVELEDVLEWED